MKQKNKGKVGDFGNLSLALKLVQKQLFKRFEVIASGSLDLRIIAGGYVFYGWGWLFKKGKWKLAKV